jgi:hypothetical protein
MCYHKTFSDVPQAQQCERLTIIELNNHQPSVASTIHRTGA